ncbi:hypothetical protein [Actinophytocola gossypii]|uniref:DUF4260 family protein n=1 Tax=Actinophytocola gossypii TaxID=2812003 RepID=A0ABT2J4J7_9PSEU|nr:hypothetical protein [Actinophytocola gossypii]MCT2582794.1 hypothetical protein [Actinophytocola gossypii]
MTAAVHVDTRATSAVLRLEHGIALAVCVALFVLHLGEVRWLPAVVLFAVIDVVGYLPGLVAHHRAGGERIAKAYYVLYNVMHSFVTHAVVVAVWVLVAGWEWALLAIPIHLCGDRALFGSTLKPFAEPFEAAS